MNDPESNTTRMFRPVRQVATPGRSLPFPTASCCGAVIIAARDNARNNARRGRPRTTWMDNINTWTGLPVEESIRMTEDGDKWRKYVQGVANPQFEDD